MKYPQVHDGEWVMPCRRKYRMMCCDCGLVHTLNFRLVGRNHIEFQVSRHTRATAAARRAEKYVVKIKHT